MIRKSSPPTSLARKIARFGRLLRTGLLGRFVMVLSAVGLIPLVIRRMRADGRWVERAFAAENRLHEAVLTRIGKQPILVFENLRVSCEIHLDELRCFPLRHPEPD